MDFYRTILDYKTAIISGIFFVFAVSFFIVLFGQTIPNVLTAFFKSAGESIILGIVFVFFISWILKARPHNKPKDFAVQCFDVFGKEVTIDGLRTNFKSHDVAWSFMKEYKKSYPLYNFALTTDDTKQEKKTIFKYI